jgi:two-component system, response regulator
MGQINDTFAVIIADDDPDERFLAQKAFEDLGFTGMLRFVQDGIELLSYLSQCITSYDYHNFTTPKFILLDINMPLKDGWESLEEIKKDPELQNIPIVIWTTSNEEQDRLRSIEMGASDFITKPESYKNLLDSLLYLIEKYCNCNVKCIRHCSFSGA